MTEAPKDYEEDGYMETFDGWLPPVTHADRGRAQQVITVMCLFCFHWKWPPAPPTTRETA